MTKIVAEKYFFELIKINLGQRKELSGIPTSDEWKDIYEISKKQTLLGIIFVAIEKLPINQRPPKTLLLQWFAYTEIITANNIKANSDAVKICKTIRNDGFRCTILKGQGIASYYPTPLLRTCGDIDIWIEGNPQQIINYLKTKSEIKGITYLHLTYDAPVSSEVEIHTFPTYFYNPYNHWNLQKYVEAQKEIFDNYIELSDGKLYVPSIEFNRFYILQHIYRHYFGEGIGLRQLLDYYYVLLKDDTKESKLRTLDIFKQTGMMKFVGATMWVMKEVFEIEEKFLLCPPNEKAGRQLLEEIMQAGNFGKYDRRLNRTNNHIIFFRVWNSIKRKIRFLTNYPQEILFDIPMRTYMYLWKYFIKY